MQILTGKYVRRGFRSGLIDVTQEEAYVTVSNSHKKIGKYYSDDILTSFESNINNTGLEVVSNSNWLTLNIAGKNIYYHAKTNIRAVVTINNKASGKKLASINVTQEKGSNTITVSASSFGLSNASPLYELALIDGTTLTFSSGGGKNSPAYYSANEGAVRMYFNNTMTITSDFRIQNILIYCCEYDGITYNASGNISASSGNVKTENAVITISNVNNMTTTISNTNNTTGLLSQLRWERLTITYTE